MLERYFWAKALLLLLRMLFHILEMRVIKKVGEADIPEDRQAKMPMSCMMNLSE